MLQGLLFAFFCLGAPQGTTPTAHASDLQSGPISKELLPFQRKLLSEGFAMASLIPKTPHIKSRCKSQEQVFVTLMDMGQPELAATYAAEIENWRQGVALGDLARLFAERNQLEQANAYLERARSYLQEHADVIADWRRERIESKIKIARQAIGAVRVIPSNKYTADPLTTPHQQGSAGDEQHTRGNSKAITVALDSVEPIVQSGNLESTHNLLLTLASLFEEHIHDEPKRKLLQNAIRNNWHALPGILRVNLSQSLAESALKQGESKLALTLLEDSSVMLGGMQWEARHLLPAMARLAQLKVRGGQEKAARLDLQGAWERYVSEREQIINIYRVGALLPLAEAHQAIKNRSQAEQIYAQAMIDCVVNPNSRPRAEDLCSILCSMAKSGFEPSAEMAFDLSAIGAALSDPW